MQTHELKLGLYHGLRSRNTLANFTSHTHILPKLKRRRLAVFISQDHLSFFFFFFHTFQKCSCTEVSLCQTLHCEVKLKLWEQAAENLNTLDISTRAPCLGTFPTPNFKLLLVAWNLNLIHTFFFHPTGRTLCLR